MAGPVRIRLLNALTSGIKAAFDVVIADIEELRMLSSATYFYKRNNVHRSFVAVAYDGFDTDAVLSTPTNDETQMVAVEGDSLEEVQELLDEALMAVPLGVDFTGGDTSIPGQVTGDLSGSVDEEAINEFIAGFQLNVGDEVRSVSSIVSGLIPQEITITPVSGANLVDGESFVLDGVTFQFDSNASVIETTSLRAVTFTGGMTASQVADAIVTAVDEAFGIADYDVEGISAYDNVDGLVVLGATIEIAFSEAVAHASFTIVETYEIVTGETSLIRNITLPDGANIIDGESITINGVVFEFDDDASVVDGPALRGVAFDALMDSDDVAESLHLAIFTAGFEVLGNVSSGHNSGTSICFVARASPVLVITEQVADPGLTITTVSEFAPDRVTVFYDGEPLEAGEDLEFSITGATNIRSVHANVHMEPDGDPHFVVVAIVNGSDQIDS